MEFYSRGVYTLEGDVDKPRRAVQIVRELARENCVKKRKNFLTQALALFLQVRQPAFSHFFIQYHGVLYIIVYTNVNNDIICVC